MPGLEWCQKLQVLLVYIFSWQFKKIFKVHQAPENPLHRIPVPENRIVQPKNHAIIVKKIILQLQCPLSPRIKIHQSITSVIAQCLAMLTQVKAAALVS